MNRKTLALLVLAFILVLQAAFAGIQVTPNCRCTKPCSIPRLIKTEYKCGNCTNGWTPECRTLYRIDYYSNCTHSISQVETRPQSSYSYCYNGRFEKINWSERYECRGNRSYIIQTARLPSSFRGKYEHEIPSNCTYGCNQSTGRCYDAPSYRYECEGNYRVKIQGCCGNIVERKPCPYGCKGGICLPKPAPVYKWKCSADGKYKIYYDASCGNEFHRVRCPTGTACSNGECVRVAAFQPTAPRTKPIYKWECRWGLFKGSYSVYVDKSCGNILKEEKCPYSCDRATGRCKEKEPEKIKLVSKHTFCDPYQKPNEPARILMKFKYSDGSEKVMLHTTCGSCQTCSNGKCIGPASGSCTTIKFNVTVRYGSRTKGTSSGQSQSFSGSQTANPITKSNYYRIYSRAGSSSSKNQCTYNSDCGLNSYCDHSGSVNVCRARSACFRG